MVLSSVVLMELLKVVKLVTGLGPYRAVLLVDAMVDTWAVA